MTTDQTPDAVRAAIASNGEQVQLDPIVAEIAALMPIERRRWSRDDYADETQDVWVARALYDRLSRIGALRPVADGVTISREDALDYKRRIDKDVFHSGPDGYTELRARQDRLADAIDAAARAGDGAT